MSVAGQTIRNIDIDHSRRPLPYSGENFPGLDMVREEAAMPATYITEQSRNASSIDAATSRLESASPIR